MNGIKIAGFGLGLAVTAASLVGLSLAVPISAPAPAPVPAVTQTQTPPQTPLIPEIVPDAASPLLPVAPPMTEGSGAEPAMGLAQDALDSAEPLPTADDPVQEEPHAVAEAPLPADVPTPQPTLPSAPPQPLSVAPDIAPPPASQILPDDSASIAAADLPSLRSAPLPQTPFSAPEMGRDALPVPPELPERDLSSVPSADTPATEKAIAADAPQAPDQPDLPAMASSPSDDTPEAPAPDDAPALDSPTPDRSTPALPGRAVMGMPGQAATRPAPATTLPPDVAANDLPLPALVRNAVTADPTLGAPLMALVLNDPGLPNAARVALAARAVPFSVALNPMDPTAATAASLYRDAGKEVFLLAAGLPDGATAADVEVTLSAYLASVPLAAGLIDLPRDGVVRNTRLLGDVLQVVARDGHGLITFAGGLGQAARAAGAAGVAHAEVFRVMDPSDESPLTIRRFLDRAVFQASQLGQVLVYGEASNDAMLEALDLWLAEGRANQVALVPASAILLGAQGLAP